MASWLLLGKFESHHRHQNPLETFQADLFYNSI